MEACGNNVRPSGARSELFPPEARAFGSKRLSPYGPCSKLHQAALIKLRLRAELPSRLANPSLRPKEREGLACPRLLLVIVAL